MNKKRLQRLGVVCMAAAMVLTTVSFPRAAKAEEGTLTQTKQINRMQIIVSESIRSIMQI